MHTHFSNFILNYLTIIIVTKLFVRVSNQFGVSPATTGDPDHGITTYKALQCLFTTLFIIFPLSLAKSMSALRYVSIVSIGAIFYTLIVRRIYSIIMMNLTY